MKKNVFMNMWMGLTYFSVMPSLLLALPQSPEVVFGNASISVTEQSAMVITVDDHSIINYESFNIAQTERVQFIQPNSSSVVLNRVTGKGSSEILGQMQSNGKIFLVNPNGVYFGPESHVDVGSLITSTLELSDSDFLNDQYEFWMKEGNEGASIVNLGTLTADADGSIALISPNVSNEGTIVATTGKVLLASGEKVTLDFTGSGLMHFAVEGSLEKAMIEQSGSIEALQGQVHISMGRVKQVIQSVINTDGISEGNAFVEENGVIHLVDSSNIRSNQVEISGREGSGVAVSGTIDVSNESGVGGFVHVFGEEISVLSAKIDASGSTGGGSILVGGDFYGKGTYFLSTKTSISEGSILTANATASGDGGKVAVWSNEVTRFNGQILALGGALFGNGGYVETSGKLGLGVTVGLVDTRATVGKVGTWLLDPYSIVINNVGTDSLVAAAEAADVSSTITINASVLNSATSNVLLSAMAEGGSITVAEGTTISIPSGYGIQFDVDPSSGKIVLQNNAAIETAGGTIALNGHVTLTGDNATFLSNVGGASGAINFLSTIDGDSALSNLTINTGPSGIVSFGGALGANFALGELTIDAGNLNIASSVYTKGKNVVVRGASLLTGDVIFDTTLGGSYSGADVSFMGAASTIDGPFKFVAESGSGTLRFDGAVGNARPLYSFKTKGSGTSLASNVTADGNTIIFESAVTVTADVTFTDNGTSGVFFLSTLDSDAALTPRAVTVSAPIGTAQFVGKVGSVQPLKTFTVSSNIIEQDSNVILNNAADNLSSLVYSAPGGIFIGCDILAGSTVASYGSLIFNNPVTFVANPGGTGTFTTAGKITLTVISDAVATVHPGVVTINGVSVGSGNLVIAGDARTLVTLQNAAINLVSLSVVADSITQDANSAIFATGNITLNASGGSTAKVLSTAASITTTSGTIAILGGATTSSVSSNLAAGTGNITLTPLTIPISYAGVMQTDGGIVTANTNNSVSLSLTGAAVIDVGDGSVVLNQVNGGQALTISGSNVATLTMSSAIGGTTPLTSLVASIGSITQTSTVAATAGVTYIAPLGVTINGASITASSASASTGLTIIGPVTLGTGVTLTTSGANGAISFNGSTSTINGGQTLNLVAGTGVATLGGAIGTGTALTSLTVTSATQVNVGSNITTSGAIAFTPAVVLTGDSTMFSTGAAAITFSSTLNGTQTLNVNGGAVGFVGIVGGINYLAGLNVVGTGITFTGANVNVVGGQTVLNGPVSLATGVTFTNNGTGVAFLGAINASVSGNTLTVTSPTGIVHFGSTIGATTATGTVTVTALDIEQLGAITPAAAGGVVFNGSHSVLLAANITTLTTGVITMNNPVTIGTTVTLAAATGAVTLAGVLSGSDGLIITTSGGAVSLAGAPYSLSSLSVTTITSLGAITQNAVSPITVIGNLTLNSVTTVTTNAPLISGGGNIALTGTTSLILTSNIATAGGNITLTGATTYNGGTISTGNGNFTAASATTLATAGASINVGSGTATFSSTLTGAQTLSVNGTAIGSLIFTGAVGAAALTSVNAEIGNITQSSTIATVGELSYDAVSGISLGGNITTTSGHVTVIGPSTLTAAVTINTSAGNKNISFEGSSSTIDGAVVFALNAGNGNIRLDGNVGVNTALTSIATSAGTGTTMIGSSVNTAGTQAYLPKIVLTGNVSMNSTNTAISFGSSCTINGNQSLFVNAGTSTVSYGAAVGNITPLTSLDTIGSGGITVAAAIKTR